MAVEALVIINQLVLAGDRGPRLNLMFVLDHQPGWPVMAEEFSTERVKQPVEVAGVVDVVVDIDIEVTDPVLTTDRTFSRDRSRPAQPRQSLLLR